RPGAETTGEWRNALHASNGVQDRCPSAVRGVFPLEVALAAKVHRRFPEPAPLGAAVTQGGPFLRHASGAIGIPLHHVDETLLAADAAREPVGRAHSPSET